MCEESDRIRVFISSKQDEFHTERIVLADKLRSAPILVPILANNWQPQRSRPEERYVQDVRRSPIYLGLFGGMYSNATRLEYEEAWRHPHREILIYVKSTARVHKRLAQFIDVLKSRHVVFPFRHVGDLLPVVVDHVYAAIGRMVARYQQVLNENGTALLGVDPSATRAKDYHGLGFPGHFSTDNLDRWARLIATLQGERKNVDRT